MIGPERSASTCAPAIRAARVEDAAPIARLAGELGYPTDAAAMRARLGLLAGQPGHWVGVAQTSTHELCGWIHVARCLVLEVGEYAEILGLVVGSQGRRGGVGRGLVAAAERWSGEQGLTSIRVRSNVARHESHLFYPSVGYLRSKTQHVYAKPLALAGPPALEA
ncbi:MAG TPA: GNAT family N-acetyltransferase [Steroidobacteraceae bacterium]|jgi:GNAT superfamily N-acetyltransferase|nr:GNAT family N-acetyltransferase [Steroidobacteraceae bacterium]